MSQQKNLLKAIQEGNLPFCMIQKQESDDLLLLTGKVEQLINLTDIPRKQGPPSGKAHGDNYETISMIPFSQIREKYPQNLTGQEPILTIKIDHQQEVATEEFLSDFSGEHIELQDQINYDLSEEQYKTIIRQIVDYEIGNGEGANFVIPRTGRASIKKFNAVKALTIFKNLLENDYGTYWKYIFYDTTRFFIGSTPERHLLVRDGKVRMNPISGTFRKDFSWKKRTELKSALMTFLHDQKEINELFMVVDEELKMMARMCNQGGSIIGPLLKEMSHLIHSEYLLSGESDKDIIELFRTSMFAATVVGSPVENACNIISKYSKKSRGYYGSAILLMGRDRKGKDILDSPITIRTVEVTTAGNLQFSVGATLVKDSDPEHELLETKVKSNALIAAITNPKATPPSPALPSLYNDDEIHEALASRNQNLSIFWFFRQTAARYLNNKITRKSPRITLIHNADDFVYMLQHMLNHLGMETKVIRFDNFRIDLDSSEIVLVGPGPGNPNNRQDTKIAKNLEIVESLMGQKRKALFICLGHQLLCKSLGFDIIRKQYPLQGAQREIDLFGRQELVGFYNTFAAISKEPKEDVEVSTMGRLHEIAAVKGSHFIGYQFHPESLLSKNGYLILNDSINHLMN